MLNGSSPFLEVLMAAKKHQAMELFGPWDIDDNGRIAVSDLRPLLLSVFPLPTSTASLSTGSYLTQVTAAATSALSLASVKNAFEHVTRRRWTAASSPAANTASAAHIPGTQLLMYMGPTLNEVYCIMDYISRENQDAEPATVGVRENVWLYSASSSACSGSNAGDAVRQEALIGFRTSGREESHEEEQLVAISNRVALLYGSMEAIFRGFCRAACCPGKPVPHFLSIDAAHIKRLTWNLHAHALGSNAVRELRQLLSTRLTSLGALDEEEEPLKLSLDAFVAILCAV